MKIKRVLLCSIIAIAAVYLGFALFFGSHFYINTVINGENYSASSADSAQKRILDISSRYALTVNGREQLSDTITSDDIMLRVEFGDELADIIKGQNMFLWPLSLFKKSEYAIDTMVTYDEEQLKKKIDALSFFKAENIRQPRNAYLSDYTENGYQIVPEDKGTVPVREKIYGAVEEAVNTLAASVDLNEDCYENAGITSEDKRLQSECEQKNRLTGIVITYRFGDETEVLDGNTIKDWLVMDGSTVDIDEELVREYVNSLSRKYDTWGRKREFKTTEGETITIAEGAYGWWMNRADETTELVAQIKSGQGGERIPVYRAQAAQYGEDDIGDTYVEIDLTSQHLWVYDGGELVEESDFVSGNVSNGNITPVGIYSITYKERNATLRGTGYVSKVSYWMPFNGNVGMHDASWRGAFGNDIYLTNGSHGCVNLPIKKAESIYGYVEKGEPVIVYGGMTSLPRTESAPEPETEQQTEPETQIEPVETENPELTLEQQVQLLIEAGLLNPDGTPVQ